MDKNKTLSATFKTAVTVIFVICLLSALTGLVGLHSYNQMVNTQLVVSGYGQMGSDSVLEKFADVSLKTIIITYIVFVLTALNGLYLISRFIKNEKTAKMFNLTVCAVCTAVLVGVFVLSVILLNQSFALIDTLPRFNDYYADGKVYYDYTYLQAYQRVVISIFIPFLVVSVTAAGLNIKGIIDNGKALKETAGSQLTQIDY